MHKLDTCPNASGSTAAKFSSASAASFVPLHFHVAPGMDLFDQIFGYLGDIGSSSAAVRLLRGSCKELGLFTGGPPKTDNDRFGSFYGPIFPPCPATLVAGAGVVGLDGSGGLSAHVHAVFCDVEGRLVGCHMAQGKAIAGSGGIDVALILIKEATFKRQIDPYTEFDIFFPQEDKG